MNPPPIEARRKRRPASACEHCRRKKIRCDRKIPCENCARAKIESCTYVFHEEAAGEPRHSWPIGMTEPSHTNDSTAVNRSLERVDMGLHEDQNKQAPFNGATAGLGKRTGFNTRFNTRFNLTSDLEAPEKSRWKDRGPSHKGSLGIDHVVPGINVTGEARHQRAGSIVEATMGIDGDSRARDEADGARNPVRPISGAVSADDGKPLRGAFVTGRFFGQSHYLNSVYQFPRVYGFIFALEADRTSDAHIKYELCKTLARVNKDPQPPLRLLNSRHYIPPRHIAERLIAVYFRTFESVFRILHEPTFLLQCSDYFAESATASEEFLVTLMLVMAIGLGFCPDITGWTARSWIQFAQAWLGPPIEKGRVTIAGVQISCLLLLARQSNNVEIDGVSVSTGSLLQLAMQTGLHIDPSLLPGLSFFDQEIRRRLWATVLEIALQSAMDSGSVPLLPVEDMDSPCPLNLADDQFDQHTQTSLRPQPLQTFTQTSTQVALMKSFPIRLEIARLVNSYRCECPYERALTLTFQLSSYYQATILCPPPNAVSGHVLHAFTFSLRVFELLILRFLLALHHPFTIKARKDPTFYFSRKVSLEVSLSLLTKIFASPTPIPGEDDYCHLALIGTGMFSNVPGQAAITVCEDLIGQLEETITPIMSVFSSISHSNLRSVIEEYMAVLSARLSINETSVRGYLLFAGLLAQVDALQSRADVQQEITSALTDALEDCCRILKARAEKSQARREDCDISHTSQPEDMLSMLDSIPSWIESDEMMHMALVNFDSCLSPSTELQEP